MEIWHKNSYLDLIWLIINYLCGKIVLNMKRFLILMTLFSVLGLGARPAFAQRFGAPEGMKNKIVVGGNVGAGYYGNALSVSLSPQVGYRLTRSLEVGTRLGYQMTYRLQCLRPLFRPFLHGIAVCQLRDLCRAVCAGGERDGLLSGYRPQHHLIEILVVQQLLGRWGIPAVFRVEELCLL